MRFKLTTFRGVDCVRVGRFPYFVNTAVHLFRVGDTLLDTGPPNQWHEVQRYLRRHGQGVRRVLCSHHHEDHAGNAARLAQLDMQVLAPRAALPSVHNSFDLQWYRAVVWGRAPPAPQVGELGAEAVPVPVAAGGDMRHFETDAPLQRVAVQPVPAPGHSPDHTCFHIPELGLLHTGDLFVTRRPVMTFHWFDPLGEIESMQRVLALPFDTLLCSHRGVVADGRAALQDRLDHLLWVQQEATRLRQEGVPLLQATRRLLGRDTWREAVMGFDVSRQHLVAKLGGYAVVEAPR